jgi:hypothetical protein
MPLPQAFFLPFLRAGRLSTLALAHAVAAASLRRVGTTDGVLHWQECLALAERWGWGQDLS